MSNEYLVSIIVPVYNAAGCISDTILSVKSQTYTNWELLLCDDDSTDDSVKIMSDFVCDNIKILPRGDYEKGAAHARNRGIDNSKGRFIAFLDADDKWESDKLEKQLEFMKQRDASFCFTGYAFADENCKPTGQIVKVPEKITYRQALGNTTIFTSTVIFDMDTLTKDDIRMPDVKSEDTATWWRVLKKLPYGYGLDEALTLYRRQSGTLSSNKMVAIARIWNLYRNVEHLNIFESSYYFVLWAFRAVFRRI